MFHYSRFVVPSQREQVLQEKKMDHINVTYNSARNEYNYRFQ